MKTVIIPFDLTIAKKITDGELDGNIVTRDGRVATLSNKRVTGAGFCATRQFPVIYTYVRINGDTLSEEKCLVAVTSKGKFYSDNRESESDLFIKLNLESSCD